MSAPETGRSGRGVQGPIRQADRIEIEQLRILSRRITAALVTIAVVAMVFTAATVTRFAIGHDVSVWIAWTLDPMVAGALLTVLLVDARLVELGTAPAGWATALRWFAGLGTWVMNVWNSIWPDGGFGVPTEVDAAGVVLHSIPPVLLIVLAEAATGYRRVIADRIRHLEGRAAAGRGTQNVGTPEGLHTVNTPDPGFLRPASKSPGPGYAEGTHIPSTPEVAAMGAAECRTHRGYTLAGTPAEHLRGAAHMVVEASADRADPWSNAGPRERVETTTRATTGPTAPVVVEGVGTGADPWSDGGRGEQAETTTQLTIDMTTGPTTSVVAGAVIPPVVAGVSLTLANDHQDDHGRDHREGNRTTTSAVARAVAPPVVAADNLSAANDHSTNRQHHHPGDHADDHTSRHREATAATWSAQSADQVRDDVRTADATDADGGFDSPSRGVTSADPPAPSAEKGFALTETPAPSPVELKRRARRMHRDAVAATRRPVTIEALQTELGLSRRAAAELRREVVALNGVARH